ncbi:translation elongation factor aEF-2 [Nanobdella aerobiophila]|uniref:Elongation factor 2 n=1 Tax=Nanobdella aerobiophila TaxID=2586965 RepID=A0A915T0A4_9ARCH|nr:elongation factor EF-2 [Nanobdella aerobiophila]BBL45844.1 translation elongation factor aEF-2 [Nanobdella aerobiophila]
MASLTDKVLKVMDNPKNIRNMEIIAHIHHGKTTLTDSLLAGAGMLAEELAGEAMFTWWHETEKQREMTVYGAAVSMVHEFENQDYLINLIDTPGHVEFSGQVTRAARASDGAIVVVDFVDGIMPQTESVLRTALKEYVKPVLFINKADRAITELKLSPQQIMERIGNIVIEVNRLIEKYTPQEFKGKWNVNVVDGSVAFGSAKFHWALSLPYMKKNNVSFKDIIDIYTKYDNDKEKLREEMRKKAPVAKVILDMVINHLPSPIEAQRYRIPHIWKGNINSEVGKAMENTDPNGPLVINVTNVIIDKISKQEIATARMFSGTLNKGDDVYLIQAGRPVKIQQVAIWKGIQRLNVDSVKAGNIIALVGIRGLYPGETIVAKVQDPKSVETFEELKHWLDPVVTKSFEPKNPNDLPKLIETLELMRREDPTIKVEQKKDTGEILVSGLGDLHLQILEYRVQNDFGIPINVSEPIVVYRESVLKQTQVHEGKSPNKHNKIYFQIEPLDPNIYEKLREYIREGKIEEGRIKKEDLWKVFNEIGFDKEEARRIIMVQNGNVLIDMTRGLVHLPEVIEYIVQGFKEVMEQGPLAWEPTIMMKVKLIDAVLHEDAIHRGPAQIIPAAKDSIKEAILEQPALFEPLQIIRIDTPPETVGDVTSLLQSRRGQVLEMDVQEERSTLKAKIPVANMFGFTDELRSTTSGKGVWYLEDQLFERVPKDLQQQIIDSIRKRKGIPEGVH